MAQYLRAVGTWADLQALDRSPRLPGADPLFAVVAHARLVEPADAGGSTP